MEGLSGVLDWREVVDRDWPKPNPITEATRTATRSYAQKVGARGDVRIAMGLFYTDAEYEAMRTAEMSRPLP